MGVRGWGIGVERDVGKREGGGGRGNGTVEEAEAGGPGRTDNEAMRFKERHLFNTSQTRGGRGAKGSSECVLSKLSGFEG